MKKLVYITCLSCLFLLVGCKAKELTIEQQQIADQRSEAIEQKRYTFTATQLTPSRGGVRHLTSEYTIKVSGDTLDVHLPFFGRAYSANIGQTDGGFKFTTTNFEYVKKNKKPGEYEIQIKPNDLQGTYNTGIILHLKLYNTGYGNATVSSANRETMNYYGTVK